jgi:plastocyanin
MSSWIWIVILSKAKDLCIPSLHAVLRFVRDGSFAIARSPHASEPFTGHVSKFNLKKEPAMSAARHLPMNEVVQTITIDSTLTPTPQAVKVAPGTEIEFVNNSGDTINITFNANPPGSPPPNAQVLFNNTANIGPGESDTLTPLLSNGSTNYMVNVVGGSSYGPFAIQVGNGPLYVQVTYDSTNNVAMCDPGTVVIPVGGALQMINTDSNSYNIGWGGITNPFNPALTTVGGNQGNSIHQGTASAGTYTYTAGKVSAGEVPGVGGGKVIISN